MTCESVYHWVLVLCSILHSKYNHLTLTSFCSLVCTWTNLNFFRVWQSTTNFCAHNPQKIILLVYPWNVSSIHFNISWSSFATRKTSELWYQWYCLFSLFLDEGVSIGIQAIWSLCPHRFFVLITLKYHVFKRSICFKMFKT